MRVVFLRFGVGAFSPTSHTWKGIQRFVHKSEYVEYIYNTIYLSIFLPFACLDEYRLSARGGADRCWKAVSRQGLAI